MALVVLYNNSERIPWSIVTRPYVFHVFLHKESFKSFRVKPIGFIIEFQRVRLGVDQIHHHTVCPVLPSPTDGTKGVSLSGDCWLGLLDGSAGQKSPGVLLGFC